MQLEFLINPDLPEREFLELYITITELQMAINTTLASTYVSSIFRQFHDAQDQVDGVFRNTLSDLMALEHITLADFTATLELDQVPYIPLVPYELNTVFYMEQVTAFAQEVSSWYRNSYAMATDQFLWMREGLFALTENFPEQENEWMEMLYLWTSYSVGYGELLEEYSEYVRLHEEALFVWHQENVDWNEALEDYQRQIEDWHQDSNFWFDDAAYWHTEYLGFLDDVIEHYESIRDFRQELEDNIIPLQGDIEAWKLQLIEYDEWLTTRLEEFVEMTEIYNQQAELSNEFQESLLEWHTLLDGYIYGILEWKYEVSAHLTEINDRQDGLQDISNDLQIAITSIEQNIISIPTPPPVLGNDLDPGNLLAAITPPGSIPTIPGLTISNWDAPSPASLLVTIPSPPADISVDSLYLWFSELQTVAQELNGRQSYIQTAVTRLNDRQFQLSNYYTSLVNYRAPLAAAYNATSTWHEDLQDIHSQMADWDSQLRQHSSTMYAWFSSVSGYTDNIMQVQLPTIPSIIEWEHVTLPEETDLPIPESVYPIEKIELPNWHDILPPPPPYEGTEILTAFDVAFPLESTALEPMDLARPEAFTDYAVPGTVDFHEHMMAIQPMNPMVGPPPRPDDFWASMDFMHAQLSSFDVDAFLSDDILRMVDHSLHSYDQFLQTVRYDISFLFQDNIWLMHDVHAEFDHLLRDIRFNALDANRAEQEALQSSIEQFATARGYSHEDTQERLATFAAMMPESRAIAGVNQELIDFTVMPFEFVPLALRDSDPAVPEAMLVAARPNHNPMMDMFQRYQTIALIAMGGVFVGTVISSLVSYVGRKRREEAEARGFM